MSSKIDAIQQAINRASLTMNLSEDMAKALLAAGVHPQLATVLMRMHHGQEQMAKEIAELRTSMLKIAQALDMGANINVATHAAINALCSRLNISAEILFGPEEADTGHVN